MRLNEIKWSPLEISYFKRFKKMVILYGTHLPYAKQILNSWATQNRILPNSLKDYQEQYWKLVLI